MTVDDHNDGGIDDTRDGQGAVYEAIRLLLGFRLSIPELKVAGFLGGSIRTGPLTFTLRVTTASLLGCLTRNELITR